MFLALSTWIELPRSVLESMFGESNRSVTPCGMSLMGSCDLVPSGN